jgi:hypothetical protein
MNHTLKIVVAVLLFSLTASAQSVSKIVLNIVSAGGPYKPYSPYRMASGSSTNAFGYDLARLGSEVIVAFDKSSSAVWFLSISSPKVGVSDVTGTPSNRFVKGTAFVSYYRVMDGPLRGACVLWMKDRSLLNLYSKSHAETKERSVCL